MQFHKYKVSLLKAKFATSIYEELAWLQKLYLDISLVLNI